MPKRTLSGPRERGPTVNVFIHSMCKLYGDHVVRERPSRFISLVEEAIGARRHGPAA